MMTRLDNIIYIYTSNIAIQEKQTILIERKSCTLTDQNYNLFLISQSVNLVEGNNLFTMIDR
jgi:hypothetical protein